MGLRHWWMFDRLCLIMRQFWVVLGGLGHWWMVMLDCRSILASVKAVWVVLLICKANLLSL